MQILKEKKCFVISLIFYCFFVQCSFSYKTTTQHSLSTKDSINLFIKQGDSLQAISKQKQSIQAYQKAFLLAKKTNNQKLLIEAKSNYSLPYTQLKKYHKAKKVLFYLDSLCGTTHNLNRRIINEINRGILKAKQKKHVESLIHYNTAIKMLENSNDDYQYWRVLNSKGLLFLDLGLPEESIKSYKKSLKYLNNTSPKNTKTSTYGNISKAFGNTKQLDSTLHYASMVLPYCKSNAITVNCLRIYNNIAYSYIKKGMPEKALQIITDNIDLNTPKASQNKNLLGSIIHTIGATQYALKNYDLAIKHFKLSERYFLNENNFFSLIITKDDLSKAYEKAGNFKAAMTTIKEIKSLELELMDHRIQKEIAKTKIMNLLNQTEERIQILEQENKKIVKNKNFIKLTTYTIGFLSICGLSFLVYRNYRNKVKFYKLNEELSLNRLKSLRSMMNPHFLFNAFSTLQYFILKKENKKANDYMTELSGLIKKVLSTSDSIFTSFTEEIELLKSYVILEKGRFGENFDITYNIDKELTKINPTIPSMIIQPYIENAIIHGFSHSEKRGLLKLSFKKHKNTINCTITDNGIGRNKAEEIKKSTTTPPHLSIATRNTDERLLILNKMENYHASISINDLFDESNNPKGTEVMIILPITKDDLN